MNTLKMQYTPGPWEVEFNYEGQHRFCPFIQVGPARISFTQGYDCLTDAARKSEAEANARLIAAAPELLEVAESILAEDMLQYLPVEYITKVRAAIAKATGSLS